MRLLVAADLHCDNARSRGGAIELIERINRELIDVLLVVGDVGNGDDDTLERSLERFTFLGPKLFVPGNHELWTRRGDSLRLHDDELPRRVRAVGWHWLPGAPFARGSVAVVGSLGWYDYTFAADYLGVPNRFYEAKISPGAARAIHSHPALFDDTSDIPDSAISVVARWNDGRFVKLPMSDESFCDRLLDQLHADLAAVASARQVVAAVHHVPFRELLPPLRMPSWDFAHAYLGSPRFGELLRACHNVSHVVCGHSHFPAEAMIDGIQAINIGSGYREKRCRVLTIG
jgi:predicted phosphodiesterase